MRNDGIARCELLHEFLLEELTAEEKAAFEAHLDACPTCRQDLREFRDVWNELPFTMEIVEPPEELKDQVFLRIFPAKKKPLRRWYAAAAGVALLAGAAYAVAQELSERQEASVKADAHLAQPAQIVREYSLKAADAAPPEAKGSAWLMQQGGKTRLVLQLSGLPVTKEQWVYQVWLLKQGKRSNCGTFKVDNRGNGVLTYELQQEEAGFDAIGITLEPDAFGDRPRGKKVLGTSS
jgi:hypothetical protein